MFCSNCGSKLNKSANFCADCGMKIEKKSLPSVEKFEFDNKILTFVKRNSNLKKLCVACVGIIMSIFILLFIIQSQDELSGTYVSESGIYSVMFETDGTCTWYQNGIFFNGAYDKTKDGWELRVLGNSGYSNTIFYVEKEWGKLIITGGTVDGEVFTKE